MSRKDEERHEELDTGEQEGIKDPTAASADHTTHIATVNKLQPFNWARDIDDSLGLSPADPDPGDAIPNLADTASTNTIPAAFVEPDPIAPVSITPPTAYGPRDFLALHSGVRNPWGSINHCNSRSHPARVQHRDLGPHSLQYSHLHTPRSTSLPQHTVNLQGHPHSHLWYPEPF